MNDNNHRMDFEVGRDIRLAFTYVRAVFRETAQLIDILDEMMGPGWKPPRSAAITEGLSRDLKRPDDWVVSDVFRIYHRRDEPDARVGITITYLHPRIDQPILIGGRIDYPPDQIAGPDDTSHRWDLRNAWFEAGSEDKKTDGTPYRVRFDDATPEDGAAEAEIFAIPLVGIQFEDDIRNKVYDRLMDL